MSASRKSVFHLTEWETWLLTTKEPLTKGQKHARLVAKKKAQEIEESQIVEEANFSRKPQSLKKAHGYVCAVH